MRTRWRFFDLYLIVGLFSGYIPGFEVSNDNPFSEAAFRTCKSRPSYAADGFSDLEQAQSWALSLDY